MSDYNIIYLKNLPIFYHWNDRAINFFIERWTLHIALQPRPRFSANSKGGCALCLRNSIVCFGCVTIVPGRCYMACRHEKEKTFGAMPCRNGCFLCKVRLNNTYSVLKVKSQVHNKSSGLRQWFGHTTINPWNRAITLNNSRAALRQ